MAVAFFLFLTSGLAIAKNSSQTSSPPELAVEATSKTEPSVEVVYFIYYGNFDCQVIQLKLAKFENELPNNVHFEALPVVVSRGQVGEDEFYTVNQYADLFFVLDFFGQEKLLRNRIFQTVMDTLANTGEFALVDIDYQMNFLNDYNLSVNEYREAIESDIVDRKIEKALDYISKFNINSVPSMVINGKTLIQYNPEKGTDHFFKAVNSAINEAIHPKPKPRVVSKSTNSSQKSE
ncbi:MAG: hypothetical protein LBI10_04550 [Deltaproteobacteria bacterium]|nr:hypothetical protein [Deltaproteobacteria bacterium]